MKTRARKEKASLSRRSKAKALEGEAPSADETLSLDESSQREPEQSAEEEEDAVMVSAAVSCDDALEESQLCGQEKRPTQQDGAEDAVVLLEDATPYIASCSARVEVLRKRKREQEERVEALVQESFGHVEAIMNFLMASLQQHHLASRAEFDASDARLSQSLHAHNRIEKKMKMIAAILLHEQEEQE